MTELSPAEQQLRSAVETARRQRQTVSSRGAQWGVDLAGAYRIQASRIGGPIKGYKIGLISPAKQAQMGIDQPIWGRVEAAMIVDGPLSLSRFIQPRWEPELVALLKAPVPADATPGTAWGAIAGFLLAVDVLDSVWEGYRFSAAEVIADNASGGAFLLGPRLLSPGQVSGTLRLWVNGQAVTEGPIEALGDAGQQLCWLARQTGGLEAGQLVGLGSPAAAMPAQTGLLEIQCGDHYASWCVKE